MGVNRDLKKANEAYWAGKLSQADLLEEGKRLRLAHWKIQKDAGIDIIPSNDFSFYDHILDHIQFFGVSLQVIDNPQPLTFCRQLQSDTHSTSLNPSMSSSPWEEVTKRAVWMFNHWYNN